MNEENTNPDEKTSIGIAKELKLIRRLLCVVIILLAAGVGGIFGMEVEELIIPAFLALIIYAISKIVSRVQDYLTERERWKKQSETPINKNLVRTSSVGPDS